MDFNDVPRDPLTNDYYAYGLTADKKYYELAATLETSSKLNTSYSISPTEDVYAWTSWDYTYLVWNYKKNLEKWYFLDHLLLLFKWSDWIKSIPRTDANIWTWNWTSMALNSGFSFLSMWSSDVPYPINSSSSYSSVSSNSGSSDFIIELTQTWIPLACPSCTN